MANKELRVIPPKSEVIEKMAALATAAFGLVAALAWNGFIQDLFVRLFGEQGDLWAKFTYAVIVTIVAVLITFWIGRLSENDEKK